MNKSVNKKRKPKMKSVRRKSPHGEKRKTIKSYNKPSKKIYGGELTNDKKSDGKSAKLSPEKDKTEKDVSNKKGDVSAKGKMEEVSRETSKKEEKEDTGVDKASASPKDGDKASASPKDGDNEENILEEEAETAIPKEEAVTDIPNDAETATTKKEKPIEGAISSPKNISGKIVGKTNEFLQIVKDLPKKLENMTTYLDPATYIDMDVIKETMKNLLTKFKNIDPDKLQEYADYMVAGMKIPMTFLAVVIDTIIKLSDMLENLQIGKLIVVPIGLLNELLKDISPVLTKLISTMLEMYAKLFEQLGPKANEIMESFFDANTGTIELFIKKSSELIIKNITQIILQIPMVGQVFMLGNTMLEGGVAFIGLGSQAVQGLGKAMNGFICAVESVETFSCLIKDNIGAVKDVFNSNVDVILRISKMFSSIIPEFSLDNDTVKKIYIPTFDIEKIDILSWFKNQIKNIENNSIKAIDNLDVDVDLGLGLDLDTDNILPKLSDKPPAPKGDAPVVTDAFKKI